jgi:hypothetical protein
MKFFSLPLGQYFSAALSAGLLLAFNPNPAFSDENCHRLEVLAHQYAGVRLTSERKQIKRQICLVFDELHSSGAPLINAFR